MTSASIEKSFREAMVDAVHFFDRVNERFWATKIRLTNMESIDPAEVLSWFGGMGSLSDLIITAVNGHSVQKDDESWINDHFEALRAREPTTWPIIVSPRVDG